MTKYLAFLRAINVGGHTVKMDDLRKRFEALGYSNVETFIASGNVIFETKSKNTQALEKQIEKALHDGLGFEVATFIRTEGELAAISAYKPFSDSDLKSSQALNIAFLSEEPVREAKAKLMALQTDIDKFHIHGREVYWLCRRKQSESTFSNAALEKAIGARSTLRGANTIRKIAEKYSSSG